MILRTRTAFYFAQGISIVVFEIYSYYKEVDHRTFKLEFITGERFTLSFFTRQLSQALEIRRTLPPAESEVDSTRVRFILLTKVEYIRT